MVHDFVIVDFILSRVQILCPGPLLYDCFTDDGMDDGSLRDSHDHLRADIEMWHKANKQTKQKHL